MLTDRQKIILQILVDDYIRSAEPVGSRTISKRPDMSISPATVRNDMSDLEELGFLEQPHTSAGRIPSQKGYRFYVDHLLQPEGFSEVDVGVLRNAFATKIDQMEQVVQQTATILSSLTNYTSIVLGPQLNTTKLHNIQLLPLADRQAVALIVADNGHVENRVVSLPEGVAPESVQHYVELLNRKLVGLPMNKLKTALLSVIADELRRHAEQFENVMTFLGELLPSRDTKAPKLYLGGKTMILNQPEFRNFEKLGPLLNMFEQKDMLFKVLEGRAEPGVQVRIGQENWLETIHDCSLITASYAINGEAVGKIAVLGPTRMDYARVIGIMEHLSRGLSGILTAWNK